MGSSFWNVHKQGDFIEICIKDVNGRTIDKFKSTKQYWPKVIAIIKEKYGFNPEKEQHEEKIDWLSTEEQEQIF